MPKVQTYNSNIVQAPAPKARVEDLSNLASFGGGQRTSQGFQAAQNLGTTVEKFVQEEKQKADNLAVTKAYGEAVKAKNKLMYDPKEGAVTKRGEDAFGISDTYIPEYDSILDNIEGNLSNDDQRAAFQKIKVNQKVDLDGDLQRHVLKETQAFDQETTQNSLEAAREDAIFNYQTPGKVGESLAIQKTLIIQHAQRNGKSPEWLQMSIKKAESDTHKAVIERMVNNGEDQKASVYYHTVKSDILGSEASKLEKVLEEGSLRGNSQRIADSIMARDLSMTDAIAEAKKKITDPKLRDYTVDRIKNDYALEKAAKQQDLEELSKKAYDIVDRTGDWRNIPEKDWTEFQGSTRAAIKAYASNKAKGIDTPTDMATWYGLKDMASDPNTRAQFRDMDLMKLRHKLNDSDMKKMIEAQSALRKGSSKELDGWRTNTQIIKDSIAPIINTKDKVGKEAYALFSQKVEEQQVIMQGKLGRELTNKEFQGIVDDLLVEGITKKGILWDDKKRLFEAKPGDTFEMDLDNVPSNDRRKIEDALRRNGIEPTEQEILKLYSRKLQGRVNAN